MSKERKKNIYIFVIILINRCLGFEKRKKVKRYSILLISKAISRTNKQTVKVQLNAIAILGGATSKKW